GGTEHRPAKEHRGQDDVRAEDIASDAARHLAERVGGKEGGVEPAPVHVAELGELFLERRFEYAPRVAVQVEQPAGGAGECAYPPADSGGTLKRCRVGHDFAC